MMGSNSTGCTEWERDYDPVTEQPRKPMKLIRVVAPHFVAGFITDGEKVVRAAPILSRRFIGLSEENARKVIAHFNWKASVVEEFECQPTDKTP